MRGDADRLRVWWSLSGLCLIAATWKLWTPQREFPQVPLFGWAGSIPAMWDWLCLAIVCGGLVSGVRIRSAQLSWLFVLVGLSGLWLVDQHRLQPWAWQLWLLAIMFVWDSGCGPDSCGSEDSCELLDQPTTRAWATSLTISIYFWSAVSKLDPQFAMTHGQTLISAFFGAIGIQVSDWPTSLRWWTALGLPSAELGVAIGLMIPRVRRLAMWGAIGLHIGLLVALGPWGLGHSAGVLVWNVAYIGHDWLLFGERSTRTRHASEGERFFDFLRRRALWSVRPRLRFGFVSFACLWPITHPWGWCDRWLAWSVYSARGSNVSVVLSAEGVARLPPSMQPLVESGELRLDQWSLSALNVPIYPELRFQRGVMKALRDRVGPENLLEVVVVSPIDEPRIQRFTTDQWSDPQWKSWLNVTPRR